MVTQTRTARDAKKALDPAPPSGTGGLARLKQAAAVESGQPSAELLAALAKEKNALHNAMKADAAADESLKAHGRAERDAVVKEAAAQVATTRCQEIQDRLLESENRQAALRQELDSAEAAEQKAKGTLESVESGDFERLIEAATLVGEAMARVRGIRSRLDEIEGEIASLHRDHTARNAEAEEAAEAYEQAVRDAGETEKVAELAAKEEIATNDALQRAQTELEDAINNKPGKSTNLPDEVLDLMSGRNAKKPNGFLAITQRSVKFDPLVKAAIKDLIDKHDIGPDKAKKMSDALVEQGLASDVNKVTERLNRQRLPDIRRAVLGAVYPKILCKRLNGKDPAQDRIVAKDTVGLTETVLSDLESKDGPLKDFAVILVDKTVSKMGINAPEGSTHRELLVAQMRGSL